MIKLSTIRELALRKGFEFPWKFFTFMEGEKEKLEKIVQKGGKDIESSTDKHCLRAYP
jgi:hypothetical protein